MFQDFKAKIKRIRPLSKIYSEDCNKSCKPTARRNVLITQAKPINQTKKAQNPLEEEPYSLLNKKYRQVCRILKQVLKQSNQQKEQIKSYWKKRYEQEVNLLKISIHEIMDKNKNLQEIIDVLRFIIKYMQLDMFNGNVQHYQERLQELFNTYSTKEISVQPDFVQNQLNLKKKESIVINKGKFDLDIVHQNVIKSVKVLRSTMKHIQQDDLSLQSQMQQQKNLFAFSRAQIQQIEDQVIKQSKQLYQLMRQSKEPIKNELLKILEERRKLKCQNNKLNDVINKYKKNIPLDQFQDEKRALKKIKQLIDPVCTLLNIQSQASKKLKSKQEEIQNLAFKMALEHQMLEIDKQRLGGAAYQKLNYLFHLHERIKGLFKEMIIDILNLLDLTAKHGNIIQSKLTFSDKSNQRYRGKLTQLKLLVLQRKENIKNRRESSRRVDQDQQSLKNVIVSVSEDFDSILNKIRQIQQVIQLQSK